MRLLSCTAPLGAFAALLLGPPALAQSGGEPGMTIFGRTLSAHVLLGLSPDYIGSDEYKVFPAGSISLS